MRRWSSMPKGKKKKKERKKTKKKLGQYTYACTYTHTYRYNLGVEDATVEFRSARSRSRPIHRPAPLLA